MILLFYYFIIIDLARRQISCTNFLRFCVHCPTNALIKLLSLCCRYSCILGRFKGSQILKNERNIQKNVQSRIVERVASYFPAITRNLLLPILSKPNVSQTAKRHFISAVAAIRKLLTRLPLSNENYHPWQSLRNQVPGSARYHSKSKDLSYN